MEQQCRLTVVVPADSADGLDARVAPGFGRAPFFVIVGADWGRILEVRVEANPAAGPAHKHGVAMRLIRELGADAVLANRIGAPAQAGLQQAGLDVVRGARGTVREAVEAYLRGEMAAAPVAPSGWHFHGPGPKDVN